MEKGPQALKWGGGGGSKGEEAGEEEEETHAWGHILYECLLRDLPSVFIYIYTFRHRHTEGAYRRTLHTRSRGNKHMHTYTYISTLIWAQTFAKPVKSEDEQN